MKFALIVFGLAFPGLILAQEGKEAQVTKPEVQLPFYASLNPWSGLWQQVLNISDQRFFAQEIGVGYWFNEKWRSSIHFTYGKRNGKEPETKSENMPKDRNDRLPSIEEYSWSDSTKVQGLSLDTLYTVFDNKKSRFSVGLGLGSYKSKEKFIRRTVTVQNVPIGSDERKTFTRSTATTTEKKTNLATFLLVYEYQIDPALSIGFRTGITSGKQRDKTRLVNEGIIYSSTEEGNEEKVNNSTETKNENGFHHTAVNGIYLTIHF